MLLLEWLNTASINFGRYWHRAFVLINGKALFTGGYADSPLNSADLY
jgi:hypothetical protein